MPSAVGRCEARSQSSCCSCWKIEPSRSSSQGCSGWSLGEETDQAVLNSVYIPAGARRVSGSTAIVGQLGSEGHRWISCPDPAYSRLLRALGPNPS